MQEREKHAVSCAAFVGTTGSSSACANANTKPCDQATQATPISSIHPASTAHTSPCDTVPKNATPKRAPLSPQQPNVPRRQCHLKSPIAKTHMSVKIKPDDAIHVKQRDLPMLKIDGTDENVDSKSARAAQLSETAIRLETQVERTATDVSNRRRALRELKRSLVVRFPLLHPFYHCF
jgi:hypothetical protein